GLHDVDETLAHQLEDRDEGDRHAHAALLGTEQARELEEAALSQHGEDVAHALADREPLALDVVVREHLGACHHLLERPQHLLQRDLRRGAPPPANSAGRERAGGGRPTRRPWSPPRGAPSPCGSRSSPSISSAARLKRSYS